LGVYGITQAIFQIPFGMLSDKVGRKQIIVFGLLLFALGGCVAAVAESIELVILGRALQGAGAVSAVVLALASDLTRDNQRTKAMAMIGMSIGLAFMIALLVAPILEFWIGVPGLFWLTSFLAILAIVLLLKVVPTPEPSHDPHTKAEVSKLGRLFRNRDLLKLNAGIFALHFVLTAMFLVVPVILMNHLEMPTNQHWQIYLPALLVSIVFMIPLIIASAKTRNIQYIFLFAIVLLVFSQALFLMRSWGAQGVMICLFVFFWGFNLLESMLPSLVSRIAPAATRGTAMGIYNTFQFSGVFAGGVIGGLVYGAVGVNGVFFACCLVLIVWAYLTYKSPLPKLYESIVARFDQENDRDWHQEAMQVRGVKEVIVLRDNNRVYLKVDKEVFNKEDLVKLGLAVD